MKPDELEVSHWVNRVFGQAVPDVDGRIMSRDMPLEAFCGPDQPTLLLLAEVFERPAVLLSKYPDAVVERAFWDLGECTFEGLWEDSIEWSVRHRLIRSFEVLFRDFFAVRCAPVLGHLSETGNALNRACYMWFDFNCWLWNRDLQPGNPLSTAVLESMDAAVLPWLPNRVPHSGNLVGSAVLDSIEAVLKIPHIACQESALHALGHWHYAHPARVEAIIDEFLTREPNLPQALVEYSGRAQRGDVL